ncbi:FecCD family ABC transporter permease [Microtetraspora malaysiensis]|uniref:FecCD family ABC transporter permease n=1 Tax=Microtetraspora malaysiensis TaxID=161358 RepID=UPI00082D761E|nr:iron ABC transporter permease [Microtetraspora malaysiensis]
MPSRGSATTAVSGLVALAIAVGVVAMLSIGVGSRFIPPDSVLSALFSPGGGFYDNVIWELRIPRTVAGLVIGAALGLSGAVMQGLTRNPIADPGILGVHAGAAFGVVVAIYVFGLLDFRAHVGFAFAGAALVSAAVWLVGSRGRDGATPVKLALAGAAISAFIGSATSLVLYADSTAFDEFRFWSVGSLAGAKADLLLAAAPFLAGGALLAFGVIRGLNALSMGADVARSLGQRVRLVRGAAALAVVLLSGTAVAAVGPIGFVGLTVPHVARALAGPDHRRVLPYSALLGPLVLLGADIVGRVVAIPSEVQVGAITAAVGAPVFIWFVRRRTVREL